MTDASCDGAGIGERNLDASSLPPPDAKSGIAAAAIFFAGGASLVVHILTGAALPLVLAALLVAGAVLFARATANREDRTRVLALLRAGIFAGLASTAVYDLTRQVLAVTLNLPVSPFKAIPFFGTALLATNPDSALTILVGSGFHILNGVCFGVGYTLLAGRRPLRWAVGYGLVLEAFMLGLYPSWLDLAALREFTQLSVVGHLAYGLALGTIVNAMLPAPFSDSRAP